MWTGARALPSIDDLLDELAVAHERAVSSEGAPGRADLRLDLDLGDLGGRADSHRRRGEILAEQAQGYLSMGHLLTARDLYRATARPADVAACELSLGGLAGIRRDYRAAGQHLQAAKVIFESIGSADGLMACEYGLGRTALEQADYIGAAIHLTKSRAICEQLGQNDNLGDCDYSLGSVALAQGKYSTALAYFEAAANIYAKLGFERE